MSNSFFPVLFESISVCSFFTAHGMISGLFKYENWALNTCEWEPSPIKFFLVGRNSKFIGASSLVGLSLVVMDSRAASTGSD